MINPFDNTALFLIQVLFDFYILVLMLRLILQFQYADYYNPVVQLIVRLTNPVIKPLQRILPSIRGVDLAIFIPLILLEFIKLSLIAWLMRGQMANHLGLLVWTIGGIGNRFLNIFFFAILLRVIMSWVAPNPTNPVNIVLFQLTEPLLRPARRLIHPISGFDLSPIVAMIVVELLAIVIFWPIIQYGSQLALR